MSSSRPKLYVILGSHACRTGILMLDHKAIDYEVVGLPAMLDRIDGWIESGVLDGEELNAADFVIAPSLALLTYRRDLRPEIERRPAIGLIDRLLPEPSAASAVTADRAT